MDGDREEVWVLGPSKRSLACFNPIRSFMEKQFVPALQQCEKKEIFKLGGGKQECIHAYHP